jgi:glycosyltransferase involved in cell wall biosynthesis
VSRPRVTYWTGTWDPDKEAISKEVQLLRFLGGSKRPVVSFSAGQTPGVDVGNRVLRLSDRQWPLLRAAAPLLELPGEINHVFGGLGWGHLLRALGRRPTLFTAALPGPALSTLSQRRVDLFAAESETLVGLLRESGVPPQRIRLIYPGIDLYQYRPGTPPALHPFRVLFASTPSRTAEFESRGIVLLVETARLCPDIEVVLLWRQWGDEEAAQRVLDGLRLPANVRLEYLGDRDMPTVYRSAHAVACLYADGFGKSCPNSIVEGLACGLPAVVADSCGIARLIADAGAGAAVARTPGAVAEALRAIRDRHHVHARAARHLAEKTFSVAEFLSSYTALYEELRVIRTPDGVRQGSRMEPSLPL